MIRVCVAGVTGWVGAPLAEAIEGSPDLSLASGVARKAAGTKRGSAQIFGSVREALQVPSEVFVDYTSAQAAKANVQEAIAAGRHVVIGSSGLSDQDFAELDAAARAKNVGVVAVGNFAITAALMQRFALEAAKYLGAWEILDTAHAGKKDAPSGTARELAWRLSQVRTPDTEVPVDQTVGDRAARGAELNGSRIHSMRLPGYTIGVEVRFGRRDERLTISYDGGPGAAPYVDGTLLAIRKAPAFVGVVRGMDRLL